MSQNLARNKKQFRQRCEDIVGEIFHGLPLNSAIAHRASARPYIKPAIMPAWVAVRMHAHIVAVLARSHRYAQRTPPSEA